MVGNAAVAQEGSRVSSANLRASEWVLWKLRVFSRDRVEAVSSGPSGWPLVEAEQPGAVNTEAGGCRPGRIPGRQAASGR